MNDLTLCARHVKPFPYCERCLRNPANTKPDPLWQSQMHPATDPVSGDCLEFAEDDNG